jgi:hypothetical protein
MSSPLMINVRKYLPGAEHPMPEDDFSEVLFHELMHHYVASVTASSALRKKFASEPLVVLNHLHVIALEKMVLSKLHETKELKLWSKNISSGRGKSSPRPGPDAFVQELKDAAKK